MNCRAALILAGGGAKRFQMPRQPWQDKAQALIDGKPLLLHVIENLKKAVDKVVVCVNDEQRMVQYRQLLEKHAIEGIEFVVDQKGSIVKGPL
jgi:molybdopterin-guanine dinucleotide biosynthesis protein A